MTKWSPGCGSLECAVLRCVSGHSVRSQRSLPDSALIRLLCVPETGSRSSCSGWPVIDFSVSPSLCHCGTPRPSGRACGFSRALSQSVVPYSAASCLLCVKCSPWLCTLLHSTPPECKEVAAGHVASVFAIGTFYTASSLML